ncbi:MAG TPA: hypothetical protein VGS08_02830 [Candidatus Saccharimonadales bacterium]|nr:hypothetical protein [Candidatus Saccharimonadales bacterium]
MDFSNRGSRIHQPQGAQATASENQAGVLHTSRKNSGEGPEWLRVITVGVVICLAIITMAIAVAFYYNGKGESKYISTANYQAVFLNNGQVYFGKVKALNDRFVDLQNIFYLSNQLSQTGVTSTVSKTASNNFSLNKLGCELHGPYDEMIINKGQITFWENIRGDGKVAQAINKWYQQNPNGLTCNS